MLNVGSLILVLMGALIILLSIFSLLKTVRFFSDYTYREKSAGKYITNACLVMMSAFFVGYLAFSFFLYVTKNSDLIMLLVSFIFFLGGLFVFCMVSMQKKMSHDISERSMETIYSLISAMEAKDIYTKGHSEHVKNIVCMLYDHLPLKYQSVIDKGKLSDAAMLHDIGKIGIPDAILNKPGALTPEEYHIVKQHPERGYMILEHTIYKEIGMWVLYHHERIDGKGYYHVPQDQVSIEPKIIAVADTFSALFTDRVYRKKYPLETCIEILQQNAGTQLDAELVEIFCGIDRSELLSASI